MKTNRTYLPIIISAYLIIIILLFTLFNANTKMIRLKDSYESETELISQKQSKALEDCKDNAGSLVKYYEEQYNALSADYTKAMNRIDLLVSLRDSGLTDRLTIEETRDLLDYTDKIPYGSPFSTGHWISSPYGLRDESLISGNNFTEGIDLIGKSGDKIVRAMADGIIIDWGVSDIYGKYIVMEHDGGFRTKYSHLELVYYQDRINWKITGVKVNKGDRLGIMGNTGLTFSESGGDGTHLDLRMWVYSNEAKEWLVLNPTSMIKYIGGDKIGE